MDYISLLFFLLTLHFIYTLSRPNPFNRILIRPKYSLRKRYNCRVSNLVEIDFKARPTSQIFRESLYNCMYSYPDTKSISFRNLGRLSMIEDRFEHFQFECIDFSNIPACDFNCQEPFNLPASYIVLPADISYVPLRYCHPEIKCIAIPSHHFVPAQEYITYFPDGKPILVNSEFCIKVPPDVLSEYTNNSVWSSIVLIDENDELFHPTFYPYYGIDN